MTQYLLTSFILKLLCLFYFIFGLWFFWENWSVLQELFNCMYHDHIWKKSTLWGPGFKICFFHFSTVAQAVCTPTMATCVFSLLSTQWQKLNLLQYWTGVLILGNSFQPNINGNLENIEEDYQRGEYWG